MELCPLVLDDKTIHFPDDRLRIHGYREFDAACDLKGDLYDYLGHIKLVNGQVPSESIVLDEAGIAAARRVDLHVQTHDDPVLKLCLWDKAASDFCEKFKASGCAARVILVTALNPKRFGVLSLSSMTPSRVFLDGDVQETRNYLSWLDLNLDVANRVKADVVIKPEPATLGELFAYMKQASAKVAWFECTATIDDVVHGSMWYYIGCGECHTKATKGPTTLMCKKCGKSEIVGVPQYLSRLSVYDHNDQAVFVLLGDAGEELTGKKAAELVESYYQANDSVGEDHIVPVPRALIDTIGQTRTFIVKVSSHNLTAKTQTLTVTKVLPLEAPEPEANLGENVDEEPVNEGDDHAAETGQLLEGRLTGNHQPNDPNHLIEGDVYEISGFSVLHNQRQRKLTQLPYYIQLGQETKMSNVTGIGPIFPLHNLSPQNYESLLHLATIPTYLPDVVGQIRMMQNTRPFHPEDNTELTVGLLLNRSTMVKLMLWDKQAADFSILQNEKNMKFKVVIFTSIIPKIFRGKLQLNSSPATRFYFNKSIEYIKHFKGRI
ncbi:hypothetical protein Bca52824_031689 [Brassica carinata]|uniref:Replication factor A C-terminal domain-containing protein n=1 Tax=Brassica carinata TaxID=52824 RepID=A0A8X7S8I4_BRACI|nr:hypothetical protein Bca52824_031689 [Brassica carinata]